MPKLAFWLKNWRFGIFLHWNFGAWFSCGRLHRC